MTAPKLPCMCGCPPGRHLMGKRDCRSCQTCSEYEPAEALPEAEVVALDVTALLGEVQDDVSREAELTAEVERLRGEIRDLSEHIPCGWCDGLGVAPGERFGRDADGAPNVDEDRPCPEGCQVPAWLQAERNDAADNERELADAKRQIGDLYKNEEVRARVLRERKEEIDGLRAELADAVRKGGMAVADSIGQQAKIRELRAEVDSLRVQLEQAEAYAQDLQERGIEAAVERLYDTHVRYLCPICGGRYREHHNHICGRLVPVRVRITFIEE